MSVTDKQKYVKWASIAEEAGRFDDAALAMKSAVETGEELTNEEILTLGYVYSTVIGSRKSSWTAILSMAQNVTNCAILSQMIQDYKEVVELEIRKICTDVLCLLDVYLLPKATTAEIKVFFLQMKGDYCRYLVEIAKGQERIDMINEVHKAYQDGFNTSVEELPPVHHARLGLALNYSVFYGDVLNQKEEAKNLATQAINEATATANDDQLGDAKLTMLLMQLNIESWKRDLQGKEMKSKKSEIESDVLETRVEELETGSDESETGLEESETGSEESEAGLEEFEAGLEELEAGLEESKPGSEESEAGSEESETGSEESEDGSEESEAGSEESGSESDKTMIDSKELQTQPKESGSDTSDTYTED
ncbi:hypothetical protein ILUMI_24136 [Ignelater luminosus]|uniref:14-3-3 domain-containing protein n=1 Tax=Ignelater luminosus TaxID=2038154 RepID=A0A8K0CAS7_IGNLU|nr:hypothetical protein ILUMI_24136 [Ignelater luminosus]